MATIETATGKKREVNWCGVSTIDGNLWMEFTKEETILSLAVLLSDSNETEKITYWQNENHNVVFDGYTSLINMSENYSGITVSLRKSS